MQGGRGKGRHIFGAPVPAVALTPQLFHPQIRGRQGGGGVGGRGESSCLCPPLGTSIPPAVLAAPQILG